MELKDLVKYYVPMRMEGSSPPNWEVVFGYDISKFKGYNVDEVRVALNLTQLWLSQGPRDMHVHTRPFLHVACSLFAAGRNIPREIHLRHEENTQPACGSMRWQWRVPTPNPGTHSDRG